ncbi:MAG: serine hydrolase [Gemmatimonadota bacterium]|nr:serine hydrolase [Gemmatimonadota bacterium]
MSIRTVVALSLLGLAIPSSSHAQDRAAADYMAAIEGPQESAGPRGMGDKTIEELMQEFGVPGITVAVIKDFEIHWAKGYGVADVETGAPVDTETMFQAASISKPVAAMAVLKAVEDGLFTLDDDINDILTSWKLDGGEFTQDRPVTPRGLHSHTSGLGDGFGFPGYDPTEPLPTVVQILEGNELSNVGPIFMERPPMHLEEYSGGGVTLMQLALSDARGAPFADVLHHDVLQPIGMTRSSFEQPISPENDRNAARAHDGEGQSRGSKWHVYPEQAAAGLWTTATDLAKFAIEVQKSAVGEANRVLSRTTVQQMLSPVGVGNFAVGFSIAKEGQGWYFSHGGGNWGFRCTLLAHKVKGYGLAIMTNADQGGAVMAELSRRIQIAYEWDSMAEPAPRGYAPPVERTEIEVAREILETYVGEYDLDGEIVTVGLEDRGLFVQPEGQGQFAIFPESEVKFFLRAVNAQVTFTKDDSGTVTGVIFHQGGRDVTAPRVR